MNAIGHSSPSFCHDSVADTMRRVAAAGFDVWEFVAEGRHDPRRHAGDFRDAAASYELTLQMHAPLSDCNLGSLIDDMWEYSVRRVEDTIRAAAKLGVTTVTVHPGNHSALSKGHYDVVHERTRKAVQRLDRLGQDLGVTLCLENVPVNWAFETESMRKLLDLIRGTEFRICFDLGHAHVARRLPEFERAASRIGNVHIHDNRGDFDAHLALDEGTLPWRRVVTRLLGRGYAGTFVVESRSHGSGRRSRQRLQVELARR